jgi:hypothetical protein
MIAGVPLGGAVYIGSDRTDVRGVKECETHYQVSPLRTELEDPKTPVLTKVIDLIPRVIVRSKAVLDGRARILRTEVDNVLRVEFQRLEI